jgi:hypothetical protein
LFQVSRFVLIDGCQIKGQLEKSQLPR